MYIKLKPYLIDLLDNYDVTEWTDMPDEYRAKCWEILKDERPNEFAELLIDIMTYGASLFRVAQGFTPYREDVSISRLGSALESDFEDWLKDNVMSVIHEINLEREEKAMDNSHEDAERTPEVQDWLTLRG